MKINKNRALVAILGMAISFSFGSLSMLGYPFGHAELQGRRPTMEDAYNATKNECCYLYGLYDGHGGSLVANQLAYNLNACIADRIKRHNPLQVPSRNIVSRCYALLQSKLSQHTSCDHEKNSSPNDFDEQIVGFLKNSYSQVNNMLDKDRCKNQGSTALTALIFNGRLFVANAGDSRAVLSHAGVAVPLSDDHKPDRPDEYERIIKAGGQVIHYDFPRVQGVLAISRAMGDFELSPYVICEPEVVSRKIEEGDQFLILACDGLWDMLTNQEAVDIVRHALTKSNDLTAAANALVQKAYKAGSTDNISALIVELKADSCNS